MPDKKIVRELTEKEANLLDLIKRVQYGKIVIYCEQGQPMRVEEGVKSSKL